MLYQIQATIVIKYSDGSSGPRQLPTFFIDSRISGIIGKQHAHNVAMEIINAGRWEMLGKCHLTIEEIDQSTQEYVMTNKRYQKRAKIKSDEAEFSLREYLGPNGKYPYDDLAQDLEDALADGKKVYLISVPGFMMVAGHPDLLSLEDPKPWHICDRTKGGYFGTAREALKA